MAVTPRTRVAGAKPPRCTSDEDVCLLLGRGERGTPLRQQLGRSGGGLGNRKRKERPAPPTAAQLLSLARDTGCRPATLSGSANPARRTEPNLKRQNRAPSSRRPLDRLRKALRGSTRTFLPASRAHASLKTSGVPGCRKARARVERKKKIINPLPSPRRACPSLER